MPTESSLKQPHTPIKIREKIEVHIQGIHETLRHQFSIGIFDGRAWSLLDHKNPLVRPQPRVAFPLDLWGALIRHIANLHTDLNNLRAALQTYSPAEKHHYRIHHIRPILDSAIPPTASYLHFVDSTPTLSDRYGIPDILHFVQHLKWHHTQSVKEKALEEKSIDLINNHIAQIDGFATDIKHHLTAIDADLKQHSAWEKEMAQHFIREYKKQCWLGTGHAHWFFGWALARSDFGRAVFEQPDTLKWGKIIQYVSKCLKEDKLQGKDPLKRASVRTFFAMKNLTDEQRALLTGAAEENAPRRAIDDIAPRSRFVSLGGPHTP